MRNLGAVGGVVFGGVRTLGRVWGCGLRRARRRTRIVLLLTNALQVAQDHRGTVHDQERAGT